MQKLKGMRALITGGSSGIGQAITLAFAKEGADIVFSYSTNKEGANNTLSDLKKLGNKASAVQANLANFNEIYYLARETTETLGGIDILVNNAGTVTRHLDFLAITSDAFDYVYAVNLKASFIFNTGVSKTNEVSGNGRKYY